MSAASKKSKTQQLKERWENGELDCGAMTPEFIKGLSPRELGMLGELITIDYFNERGYTLLEQGYRCTEGEADLVLLVAMATDGEFSLPNRRADAEPGEDAPPPQTPMDDVRGIAERQLEELGVTGQLRVVVDKPGPAAIHPRTSGMASACR